MFARVTTSSMPKDKIDENSKFMAENTFPGSKKQKGYKGFLTMTNPETGERVTVSLWDTEADMKASEKASYFIKSRKMVAATGAKILSTKYYTVGIKD
jgi:heme-degrading monooxygenase HmoA